mgnify:CR=1 FL=1
MQKVAELYRGKAKTVYTTDDPDLLVLEFRNDTSAGDGARIEQFDRKGMVNNKFNHFIMTKLEQAGIPTQMVKLLSDNEVLVKKLEMVPVECVVRNRAAGSLVKRLGVEEGIELNPPLFDLFLKNDALHDPMVNDSYCTTFGWVNEKNLARMKELTYKARAARPSRMSKVGSKEVMRKRVSCNVDDVLADSDEYAHHSITC